MSPAGSREARVRLAGAWRGLGAALRSRRPDDVRAAFLARAGVVEARERLRAALADAVGAGATVADAARAAGVTRSTAYAWCDTAAGGGQG